ncbi:hypothetical protein SPBRAN_952 [uncultured Candidatus Thioglobus sp.]|nr:hypothetical protein SPBRAN_952 [uncultured Candidatus Thioglobus sp.]
MNNHQNTTFYPLSNFIKTCRSPAGTVFNKNSNLAKSITLLIIPFMQRSQFK